MKYIITSGTISLLFIIRDLFINKKFSPQIR